MKEVYLDGELVKLVDHRGTAYVEALERTLKRKLVADYREVLREGKTIRILLDTKRLTYLGGGTGVTNCIELFTLEIRPEDLYN